MNEHAYRIVPGLSAAQVADVNAWFATRPVYADAHVPQTARNRGQGHQPRDTLPPTEERFCACTEDAILAPHLFELGLSYTDVAAEYLDQDPPVAYSMNAFWTRPGATEPYWDIQEFHRDADDVRFLALFVFLTDVLEKADGPHQIQGADDVIRTVYGPAGTAFLADTSYPHRGLKPTHRERGIAWYRYGVSPRPAANVWDKVEPVPAASLGSRYPTDPRLRESVRLLVR